MKPNISTQEKGIDEFLSMLEKHHYLIPSFQRDFVWDRDDIIGLWDSIYSFYPVGSILCWDTEVSLNMHRRAGGIYHPDSSGDSGRKIYILDGQQRATSLLLGVSERRGIIRGRNNIDYNLYFDAMNGIFFFADEYKRRKKEVNPDFLISLKDVHSSGPAVFKDALKKSAGYHIVEKNIIELQNVFNNYKLPLIFIKGFQISDVCKIFERINQKGKDLKSMDIMIARTFQNYRYMVEEDF